MPEQNNYMTPDEFLDKFYVAYKRGDIGAGFLDKLVQSPDRFMTWYSEGKSRLKTKEIQELYQAVANAMDDNSIEAKRFLNLVKSVTTLYGDLANDANNKWMLDQCTERIIDAIDMGIIKNPKNTYQLTKRIYDRGAYEIATHQLATPSDVRDYINKHADPDKNISVVQDMLPVLDRLCTRVGQEIDKIKKEKSFDTRDELNALNIGTITDIAKKLISIMDNQIRNRIGNWTQSNEQTTRRFLENVIQEFSIDNIMAFMRQNAQQEFEASTRMKLADLQAEYAKTQSDLVKTRLELDGKQSDIEQLRKRLDLREGQMTLNTRRVEDMEKFVTELANLMQTVKIDIEKTGGLPLFKLKAIEKITNEAADKFFEKHNDVLKGQEQYQAAMQEKLRTFRNSGGRFEI